MTKPTTSRLMKADSIDELLGVIPAMFGFHLTDSFVAIATHGARKRLGFRMRVDLPDADEVEQVAAGIAHELRSAGADGVVLVCYSDDPGPSGRIFEATRRLLGGIQLVEAVRAGRDRYWSYLCDDERCCPPAGNAYDIRSSELLAEAVFAGMPVLADRRALLTTLSPVTGQARNRMMLATRDALAAATQDLTRPTGVSSGVGLASVTPAIDRALAGGPDPTDQEAASISVWLTAIAVRDELWTRITCDNADDYASLWSGLARRVVPPFEPAVLSLAAFACWMKGDGILCRAALDRALEADPDYSMAQLIGEALDARLSPRFWPNRLGVDDLRP